MIDLAVSVPPTIMQITGTKFPLASEYGRITGVIPVIW